MGLLYQKNAEMNDGYSQGAAEIMQKVMGGEGKVYIKGQDLFVLRNNSMKYKLLIELRNVAWPEEAWALRFAEMRQEDAEKVVRGILAFFGS
jgi:N-acetylmuramoyl-L-alanine amidase